jgi:hypothetical protein
MGFKQGEKLNKNEVGQRIETCISASLDTGSRVLCLWSASKTPLPDRGLSVKNMYALSYIHDNNVRLRHAIYHQYKHLNLTLPSNRQDSIFGPARCAF